MNDAATHTQGYLQAEEAAQHAKNLLFLHGAMEVTRKALKRCMEETGLSIAQVAEKTELSTSTIRKLLRGERISANSTWKLMALGEAFQTAMMDELKTIGFKG